MKAKESLEMNLNQVLDQFLGGQSGESGKPGVPANPSGSIPGGLLGGLAAGGLLGLVAGNKKLRKSAAKFTGGAIAVGGAAALGAVAYNAYRKWQNNTITTSRPQTAGIPATHPLAPEEFDPSNNTAADGRPFQIALIEAMIAAAHADGHVDQAEQKAIFQAIGKLPLEAGDKAAIFDALQSPPEPETIAGYANGLEQASELYLVSRLAIEPDHPQEKLYLERLSGALGLPDGLVEELEREMTGARPKAA